MANPIVTSNAGLNIPTLGPYSANNSPANVAFPAGLDIQATVPSDGRTVVFDDVQRKSMRYVYPGLEVRVLSTGRKWMFRRLNHPAGVLANNDAWWEDVTEGVVTSGYLGTWDTADEFPGRDMANVRPGNYYLVSVAGDASLEDGEPPLSWEIGDIAIWADGIGWERIANYQPSLPSNLTSIDINDFQEAVSGVIRTNAVLEYDPSRSFKKGQLVGVVEDFSDVRQAGAPGNPSWQPSPGGDPVPNTGQDHNTQKMAVSIYQALRETLPNEPLDEPSAYRLIATTNYNRLFGRLVVDNTAGPGGSNAAGHDGGGVFLDARETMRRVTAAVATAQTNGDGVIDGGYPDSLLPPAHP